MRLQLFLRCLLVLTSISMAPLVANATIVMTTQNGLVNYVDSGVYGTSESLTPQQKLDSCIKIAKKGDVEQALDSAIAAKNLLPQNHLFSVRYIDTLIRMAKFADEDAQMAIFKEAYETIRLLKTNSPFDGLNNPETAYHFMVCIGNFAEACNADHQKAANKLKTIQARIARNLNTNPAYPPDAKQSLSAPIVGAAQVHAIKGETELALQALTEACDLGYCEFEALRSDESLAKIDDAAFAAHLEKLESAYAVKVKTWSEQEIAQFQPFSFDFKIDDVEGGSFDKSEFKNEVLVIDFWATWCAPCREGIPHFIKLQDEMGDKGVQVLGISMDSPDDPASSIATINKFMQLQGFNYPCGLGTTALAQRIPGEMKLPTTVFVDRSGNVRYIARGYLDYAKIAALTETLADEHVAGEQHVGTQIINNFGG